MANRQLRLATSQAGHAGFDSRHRLKADLWQLSVSVPKRHPGQMTTRLDLPSLRHQLDRLLLLLEERSGATIELKANHYWLLETSEMFCLDSVPAPDAGLLSDDVDELTAMASRPDEDLVPWHDLK